MAELQNCTIQEGRSVVVDGDPGVRAYSDVLYVPAGHHTPAGLYDRGRVLISSAAHFAAWPEPKPAIEAYFAVEEPDLAQEITDDVTYFYGHHVAHHYGHFLFSILARLWALPYGRSSRFKILVLHRPSASVMQGFVGQVLAALGLGEDDLVAFDRPVRLRNVIVPSPAFSENNIAYSAYRSVCQAVGRTIVPDATVERSDRPVFLSKSRLTSGFNAFCNEHEMHEAIEKRGIEIVFPEALTIEQQIRLFKERRFVLGAVGSALHTCIFGPPARMIGLSQRESISSNQIMLDRLNGNRSMYVYSNQTRWIGRSDRFLNIYEIYDPKGVAEELIRLCEHMIAGDSSVSPAGYRWSTDIAPTPEHMSGEGWKFDFPYRASHAPLESLGEGWSVPEAMSVWSDGPRSTIRLPTPSATSGYEVEIFATPFTLPVNPSRTIRIFASNRLIDTKIVSAQFQALISLEKDDLDAEGYINLVFEYDPCPSPAEAQISADYRKLGIALQRITVRGM